MSAYTPILPFPATAHWPGPPKGYTAHPYERDGYVLRGPKGTVHTMVWAQNGSAEAADWKYMPIPTLADPAAFLAAREAPEPTPERQEPEPAPDEAVEALAPTEAPAEAPAKGRKPGAAPQGEPLPESADWPFTLLGHDHGVYYYMGRDTDQLTALKPSQHNGQNLAMLAPMSFWVRHWPSRKGFDSEGAGFDLIDAQHTVGVYSADRIRGRGAWWDNEKQRAIVHLGDRLIIEGRETGLHDHGTRFIYEAAPALPYAEALRSSEASKLTALCTRISWESPLSARLLAGWIACAQICGAIRWKPNLQLLAPKEAGKSTVIEKIVWPALGKNVLYAVGGTTEASIRAMLRSDAIPIIIDDMDSSTARQRENNQALYNLMRVFSGEGGGAQYKASQNGGAPNVYKIHSCYIYSGITLEASAGADISRIAVLKMRQRTFEKDQFTNLLAELESVLTPEFSAGLFARCIKLIPQIRKNAETFAQHFASQTGSRRCGDVNGHLIAGCYALHSEGLITREAAAEYISRAEVMALIYEEKQAVTENNDGDKCLSHLMEQVLTDTHEGKMMRASVYELLQRSRSGFSDAEHAIKLLRRTGIIVREGDFYVANDHSILKELFAKSSWPNGWGSVLKSIKGARVGDRANFGGRFSRSTCFSIASVIGAAHSEPPPDDDILI